MAMFMLELLMAMDDACWRLYCCTSVISTSLLEEINYLEKDLNQENVSQVFVLPAQSQSRFSRTSTGVPDTQHPKISTNETF